MTFAVCLILTWARKKNSLTFHESDWLFNDGILISRFMKYSPYNGGVFHPLYTLNNKTSTQTFQDAHLLLGWNFVVWRSQTVHVCTAGRCSPPLLGRGPLWKPPRRFGRGFSGPSTLEAGSLSWSLEMELVWVSYVTLINGITLTHRIHGNGIIFNLHELLSFMVNVGCHTWILWVRILPHRKSNDEQGVFSITETKRKTVRFHGTHS